MTNRNSKMGVAITVIIMDIMILSVVGIRAVGIRLGIRTVVVIHTDKGGNFQYENRHVMVLLTETPCKGPPILAKSHSVLVAYEYIRPETPFCPHRPGYVVCVMT